MPKDMNSPPRPPQWLYCRFIPLLLLLCALVELILTDNKNWMHSKHNKSILWKSGWRSGSSCLTCCITLLSTCPSIAADDMKDASCRSARALWQTPHIIQGSSLFICHYTTHSRIIEMEVHNQKISIQETLSNPLWLCEHQESKHKYKYLNIEYKQSPALIHIVPL